jgi:type VI secretion system secreted protein Hcp
VIPNSPAPGGAAADIFLHLQTKRAGKAKGEATNPGHEDDIVVLGWQWGLAASSAIGSAQATGRRSYTAMTVRKSIDRATTALMSALATNDEVKEARLTMRRAGGAQEDFFKITLKGARIAKVEHLTDADGTTHETIGIVFTKVEVEYNPQLASGLRSGSTTFSDEIAPDAG